MRILLATFSDILPFAVNEVLNPEVEFCAVVVDDVDSAKRILPSEKIFSLFELKECLNDFYYDFAICISDKTMIYLLPEPFRDNGLPKNKFVHLHDVDGEYNFQLTKKFQDFKENFADFEIFATSPAYPDFGLNADKFSKKIFDFSIGGQDLYYSYKIAEKIFSEENKIQSVLIGLAPYSFNYDLSVGYDFNFGILPYFVAFKDVHNFWLKSDEYKNLFNENYFSRKIFEEEEKNFSSEGMSYFEKMNVRNYVETWNGRNFPATRAENIKIFDEYLTLCEKNSVRPIIFLPPASQGFMKHFCRERLGEFYQIINEALQKHSTAKFFNGWNLSGFTDEYFYDAEHFNSKGAEKFSEILNDFISN